MGTYDKAVAYNDREMLAGRFTDEMIAELVKAWQAARGLSADGHCGPATQATIVTALVAAQPKPSATPAIWERFDGPLLAVPRNRSEVYSVFGNPGSGKVDPAWEKANIVETRDMPGVPRKFYFQCHRLVEPYMREGLRRAEQADPSFKIYKAASFVFRHQRHDVKRPLSYHSWGIAIDINADDNFSKTFDGVAPTPWSKEWMAIWPKSVTRPFVEAMESVGFLWGGRWNDFLDPMHFEFVGSKVAV